ncbi:tyrosine-type recombinase/integrase [Duganella sp. FT50W]|uniref:Tyrosine-type recombinase/integrase n=1 Tax=Duganella lactea TaxID=2692173 RepID=A0A6L8MMR4_9BURK|nr:gamma-mobile-trio recombinase GmtY [Duganella lactea]MYM81815.1 tyrosine-type recombinase/integrase [Duganella lactea]
MFVSSKIRVLTDETGASVEIPGLVTPAGVLTPLVDYCLTRRHDRSIVWMSKVVRSVQMFLEYMHANPSEQDTYILFRNFAQRLYTGTFDLETGFDPSWLTWWPRSAPDAQHIITDLSLFFEWLGKERPRAAQINPRYAGSAFDSACDSAAYLQRRDAALLGHTWGAKPSVHALGFKVRAKRRPHVDTANPPAFPDDKFKELLNIGFKVGNDFDYRGILITLLCHGGGFRESEPFHLYIEDVVQDPLNPKSALVRIHHPSQGFAPRGWRDARGRELKGNRASYLGKRFGLVPRNEMLSNRAAGWKGGALDGDYYKEAHWFEPELGELFLVVWQKYLHQVAKVNRTHPFAFINLRREPIGDMYTIAQFARAHANACRRIGLVVSKELGTTPHGHRHSYGRRLKKGGVGTAFLRKCMHHSSEDSQTVYTSPSAEETRNVLQAASENMRSAHPHRVVAVEDFEMVTHA